jgi:Flp pilus assembly protein CpaB
VQVVRMPENAVPAGAFSTYRDVADRWVKFPMLAGEPILDPKLAPAGEPVGLIARIPDGMRAFTLEVNEQAGVAGFVMPDHRVDVMLARQRGNANGMRMESELILQDIMVLASGQSITRPDDAKVTQVRSVTLAVTPDQVNKLNAARTAGTLTLALRGNNDHAVVETKPDKEEEAKVEKVAVVVAATDLNPGDILGPDNVQMEDVPKTDTDRLSDYFSDLREVIGKKIGHAVRSGSALSRPHIAPMEKPKVVEARPRIAIPKGYRTFTLRLDGKIEAEKIEAGDRVDVYQTRIDSENVQGSAAVRVGAAAAAIDKVEDGGARGEAGAVEAGRSETRTSIESRHHTRLLLQDILIVDSPYRREVEFEEGQAAPPTKNATITLAIPAEEVSSFQTELSLASVLRLVPRPEGDHSRLLTSNPVPPGTLYIHHKRFETPQKFPVGPGTPGVSWLVDPDVNEPQAPVESPESSPRPPKRPERSTLTQVER